MAANRKMVATAATYEAARSANIARNQEYLHALGLAEAAAAVRPAPSPVAKRMRLLSSSPEPTPRKQSRRLRGEAAPPLFALDVDRAVAQARAGLVNPDNPGAGALIQGAVDTPWVRTAGLGRRLWRAVKQTDRETVVHEIPDELYLPLSLASIATTVHALGHIHTKADKARYWSNYLCMYHHPYPVGYRASKTYRGYMFTMEILEGAPHAGPIFRLTQGTDPPRVWDGSAPTNPWTDALIANRWGATRVSGPLFFGFSDPMVQALIEALPGYQPWDDVWAEVVAAHSSAADDASAAPPPPPISLTDTPAPVAAGQRRPRGRPPRNPRA